MPDHLAADPLDAHQLVDGAERMPFPVANDLRSLGGSDARKKTEDTRVSGIEVHDAVNGLGRPGARREGEAHETDQTRNDPGARATHAPLSVGAQTGFLARLQAASTAYCVVLGAQKWMIALGFETSAMLPRVPASRHS